ncbi:MAG: hypothetical protein ACTTKL_06955 [Treponema sp.]
MVKHILKFAVCAAFSAAAFSCKSTKVIPADATYAQLIQMGQDAFSGARYRAAERYYTAVIYRYGMDTRAYIEARYELGHLYLRRRRYAQAYRSFNEILGIFENAEYGSVPPAYKKLAQMGMDKIPEKYKTQEEEATAAQPAKNIIITEENPPETQESELEAAPETLQNPVEEAPEEETAAAENE